MTEITYIQGNSFSLSVPLLKRVVAKENDTTTITTEPFIPASGDAVTVKLIGERRQYTYTPTMSDNVAVVELSGNELCGRYAIEVTILTANGERMRYAQPMALALVPYTGTVDSIVVGSATLDASIFFVMRGQKGDKGDKGDDGVGITSIKKTSTAGLVDTYTITLSNGDTTTFDVTNGKDGVDLGLATIINDLDTGGATDVLSAEMGKVLGERTRIRQTIQATSLCTFGAFYNYQTGALTSNTNYKYTLIPLAHILRLDVTGCYQTAVHYFASDGTTYLGHTTSAVLTPANFPSGAVYCGWSYNATDYLNVVIDYDSNKEISDTLQGIVAEQVISVPVYRGSIDATTGEDTGYLGSNWLVSKIFIPLCGATGIYITASNSANNNNTTAGVYWYDKNKKFISYKLTCRGSLVPANAVYCKVRLGAYTTGETTAQVYLYNAKDNGKDYKDLQVGVGNISPRILAGRSVAFLGDSITNTTGYVENFGIISGATITKYAVSGAPYAGGSIAAQATNLTGNEDVVVMMGGTNDFNQSKVIGDIYSESGGSMVATTDTSTFCGGLHRAIQAIYAKCPTVQIVIITPPQRSNGWTANTAGKYLFEYADAIKKVAELYGIPVVDQFSNCGINPMMNAMKSVYFNSDGTHPNSTYHKLLAEWLYTAISAWVKSPYD